MSENNTLSLRERRGELHTKLIGYLWAFIKYGLITLVGFLVYLYIFELPRFSEIENPKSVVASEVLAADGTSLGRYYLENRVPARYTDLPKHMVDALVATEDERFLEHSGVDMRAIARSASGVFTGSAKGGASTVSQQLAKLLFERPKREGINRLLWPFVMFKTKIKEWLVAIELERRYTKEEIVAMYFNKFNFIYGAYGVKTASEIYFGKTPQDLKIEESAMLVGMLQNPAKWNPKRFPEAARKRREIVLKQMQKKGFINQAQYDSLRRLPLDMSRFKVRDHKDGIAPYFREELRKEVAKLLKDVKKSDGTGYELYTDGLKIHTTIDEKKYRLFIRQIKS